MLPGLSLWIRSQLKFDPTNDEPLPLLLTTLIHPQKTVTMEEKKGDEIRSDSKNSG